MLFQFLVRYQNCRFISHLRTDKLISFFFFASPKNTKIEFHWFHFQIFFFVLRPFLSPLCLCDMPVAHFFFLLVLLRTRENDCDIYITTILKNFLYVHSSRTERQKKIFGHSFGWFYDTFLLEPVYSVRKCLCEESRYTNLNFFIFF